MNSLVRSFVLHLGQRLHLHVTAIQINEKEIKCWLCFSLVFALTQNLLVAGKKCNQVLFLGTKVMTMNVLTTMCSGLTVKCTLVYTSFLFPGKVG